MKNEKLLIFTLLVLVGFCSCDKKDVRKNQKARVEVISTAREGGDDDEDPIIQGFVYDQGVLVDSVRTSIIPAGTNDTLASTEDNGFTMQVPPGSYYFEVAPDGKDSVTTDDFSVLSDMEIHIHLDSL